MFDSDIKMRPRIVVFCPYPKLILISSLNAGLVKAGGLVRLLSPKLRVEGSIPSVRSTKSGIPVLGCLHRLEERPADRVGVCSGHVEFFFKLGL